ncbi:MAG: RNA polymerase-binding protein RbpA, partial [Thermobifida fusca]|nr:RNA polymerase-binding protein RbpA [Thermobifida fusca]
NALVVNGEKKPAEEKKTKPARTHWDMLLERRSLEDLEEVLAERLEVLRARRREEQKQMRSLSQERRSA